MDSTTLKIASTLSIVAPLMLNGAAVMKAGTLGRLFFIFLLAGLITDLGLWYIQANHYKGVSLYIFNSYSFLEALFFFWLIRHLATNTTLRRVVSYFLYGTIAWIFLLNMSTIDSGKSSQSIPFSTFYEVGAAFLSGFALLSMAERNSQLAKSWEFWLLSGVFFYCFSTFFVMMLLGSQLSLNLWPLNNVINILTNLLYCVGWWRYRVESKPRPSPKAPSTT